MAKYIEKLTPEMEAAIPGWVDRCIRIGLQTGETDWERGIRGLEVAYRKADIPFPNVVRVNGPMTGAFAASIADAILGADKTYDALHECDSLTLPETVRTAVDAMTSKADVESLRDGIARAVTEAVTGAVELRPDGQGKKVTLNLRGVKSSWHYWLGGQFWIGEWYDGPARVGFLTDICGLELEPDIKERADAYRDICESVNYIWPNRAFVMICARPVRISRDDQGRLHNDQVKAIEYPDGWGLYSLDGVTLEQEMFQRIVSNTMTMEQMMKIPDQDKRAVALKYSPETIVRDAEEVHRSERQNILYKVTGKPINKLIGQKTLWLLKMKCPTGRDFVSFIPNEIATKHTDADDCQAWRCRIRPEFYRNLRNEG